MKEYKPLLLEITPLCSKFKCDIMVNLDTQGHHPECLRVNEKFGYLFDYVPIRGAHFHTEGQWHVWDGRDWIPCTRVNCGLCLEVNQKDT